MAKNNNKNNKKNLLKQTQEWWKTDTAKAIATIIAVLLIPASVLAWNYASSRDVDIENTNEPEASQEQKQEQGQKPADDSEQSTQENDVKDEPDANSEPAIKPAADSETPLDENETTAPAVGGVGGIDEVNQLPNTSAY